MIHYAKCNFTLKERSYSVHYTGVYIHSLSADALCISIF